MLFAIGSILLLLIILYMLIPNRTLFHSAVNTERHLAKLTRKSVSIDDGEIVYLEGGSGQTLLMLHGFGADKDNWVRMAKHLTHRYHVVAPDLPGFGESVKNPDLDYGISDQVTRLHQFASAINLDEFHIGGNSMGGYLAGNYAVQHADKVISVGLLNPLGIASSPDSEMFAMLRQHQRPKVLVGDSKQYRELLAFAFYKVPFIPSFVVEELAKQAQEDFPLHEKIFQDIHAMSNGQPHFSDPLDVVLRSIQKPVLIIWGDSDRILHPKGASILQSSIPNAKAEVMKNMGHLPMIESPSNTAKIYLNFIQCSTQ
ncbi:alpha/beta hydrolase [Enterovibrio sp. ZSDZ35]|uniref:Alpha/beta hydrolase n=1 Tax=Enterovibrio qingdaonensis TaxID=2899818 RepID=A0ABT5QRQ4_9GAMM|nr:alpha/beta hydrolase [Enterovibrio sp. ZSDZ35]MDD1783363.1 alpha/beta hydrolase [Enterovibrio sp. ZSDZ35]